MSRVDPEPVLEDFEDLLGKLDEVTELDERGTTFYEDVK